MDDLNAVRSLGFWNLSPGLLRTFAWSADFNPYTVQPTNAQTWIRIHGLAREYWRPQILFEIAGAIGILLALDKATKKRTFGHFARILIDVDLNSNLRERILVEMNVIDFYVDVEYENLPPFCHSCQIIGHFFKNCKYQIPLKKFKSLVHKPKMQTVDVPSAPEGGNQSLTNEDPLVEVMIRAKEAVFNVVGDVIIPEVEISSIPSGVVKPVQVEDVRAKEPTTTPKVDPQTPNLGLVGSRSGIGDSGYRMYTDEEENATVTKTNDLATQQKVDQPSPIVGSWGAKDKFGSRFQLVVVNALNMYLCSRYMVRFTTRAKTPQGGWRRP